MIRERERERERLVCLDEVSWLDAAATGDDTYSVRYLLFLVSSFYRWEMFERKYASMTHCCLLHVLWVEAFSLTLLARTKINYPLTISSGV